MFPGCRFFRVLPFLDIPKHDLEVALRGFGVAWSRQTSSQHAIRKWMSRTKHPKTRAEWCHLTFGPGVWETILNTIVFEGGTNPFWWKTATSKLADMAIDGCCLFCFVFNTKSHRKQLRKQHWTNSTLGFSANDMAYLATVCIMTRIESVSCWR